MSKLDDIKKILLKPWIIIPVLVVFMGGSFLAGDLAHGHFTNPLAAKVTASDQPDFSSLNDLYALMKSKFDGSITAQAALDGARKGLVAAGGDPYTVYMDATEAKSLADSLGGKLSGIGAEIGTKNGLITIIAPIKDTPASRAGLLAGDVIGKINGEDTTNMSVDTAVSKIRGDKGTKVTLHIGRVGADPFDVTITRDDIVVPSVNWSLKNSDVAYIEVTRFGDDTTTLIQQAATELKSQGAKKVILDLRNDGGGYLSAGQAVASQFMSAGKTVVSERTNGKTTNTLVAQSGGQLIGLPMVVLINGGSASASEIVAGALHDNKVAQLVGEKSFGKGSVQEIDNLNGGAQLKVTVAHWYTPNGININKEGITPDVEVKLTTDDYNANRDPQLDKALDLLK